MLELRPELMRALPKPHRHLATLARAITQTRTGRQDRPPTTATTPRPAKDPRPARTAAKAATTSPARCAPRLPQRSLSARDDLRHAPVDPHLGII